MEAGVELDAQVASVVFRFIVVYDSSEAPRLRDVRNQSWQAVPQYSTDTITAYRVVEWFKVKGFTAVIHSDVDNLPAIWTVTFHSMNMTPLIKGTGETVALAICIAGLGLQALLG